MGRIKLPLGLVVYRLPEQWIMSYSHTNLSGCIVEVSRGKVR